MYFIFLSISCISMNFNISLLHFRIILTQTRWLIELGITNARYGWFNLAITGVPETIFIVLAIKHVLPKIDWKDPKRVLGVSFSLWAWAMSLVSCYFSAPANNQIREIARIADYLKVLANFGRLQVMMATDLLSLTSIGI
ncbi:hypothetical protein BKA69DRAFT_1062801 [Paraphysoderma sedebokerense]|nr:hypothetical protein BKA69DRAFT_1062801 [Paraphysoderma sedebokerense]